MRDRARPRRRPPLLAVAAIRTATLMLPRGQVRNRYRSELTAELYEMTFREQVGYACSTILSAPALHQALVETGRLEEPHSTIWCRFRLHHDWVRRSTTDGGRYRHCRACGLDDDGTINQSFGGWMGSNVPPSNGRD
jgi:hypothetical protein